MPIWRSVLCVILLSAGLPIRAADDQASFTVTTDGHRSTFQIGERIPLELSFIGPAEKRFELTNASYDRSGRMSFEEFEVTPKSGWSDPLATYFGSQGIFMMGGLSSLVVLSPTPYVMHLNLNEWVRFDQPGSYTVVVTTHRVADHFDANPDFSLKSNPFHLEIVPATSAWQTNRLSEIVGKLPKDTAAVADLRYLGTPAAANLMAQHLRDDEPTMLYECAFGLLGLPDSVRPRAVAAMSKLILDPDFPISGWFLITLPVLQVASDKPENQQTERTRLNKVAWQSVLEALPQKKGRARAETVQTLLNSPPGEISQADKDQLGTILQASLTDLPTDKLLWALQQHWDLIESPAVRPALERLAKKSLANPGSNEVDAYTTRQLKSIAFQRWFQLDPAGAREEAIRQIGSAHPSMTADSLALLKNERLPEFESIWAKGLTEATDYQQETMFASLLAHYGTGDAVPIVRQDAESKVGEWACAPQGAALGYLVKFDPAGARSLVERAVQARGSGKTACNHSIFGDIARYSHDPILRQIANQAIDDPDPEVVMNAASYLKAYGDAADEKAISNRYAEWSQKWRGHAGDLEHRDPGSLTGNWQEIGLGQNLAIALIANQGWFATEALIQTTLDQCIDEQICLQLNYLASRARTQPYSISASKQGETEIFEIAQYTANSLELLDAKIAQFPQNARFVIVTHGSPTHEQKELDNEVKALLQKHSMVVTEPHP